MPIGCVCVHGPLHNFSDPGYDHACDTQRDVISTAFRGVTARDSINSFLRKCLHDAEGIQRGSSWPRGPFSCLSRVTLICDFHAQTRSKEWPLYPINQFRITVLKTLGKSKSSQEWLNCRVCFMMHINPCINPKGLFHKSIASLAYT